MAHKFGLPIGNGTIENRGKNRWRIRFSLGKNPSTGKYENSPSITVAGSKSDAIKAREEYRQQLMVKEGIAEEALTVSEYIEQWQAMREISSDVKQSTCDRDRPILNRIIHYFGKIELASLDVGTIKRVYSCALTKDNLSKNQHHMLHQKLKQVLDDAAADGLINANPASNKKIKAPRPESAERNSLSKDEAVRLRFCDYDSQDYSRFIAIGIGLGTGCRRGEVLGLQWKHVTLGDNATITIKQQLVKKQTGYEPPKTKKAYRTIAIDRESSDMLKSWKDAQASFLEHLNIQQTEETPVITDRNGDLHDPDNYSNWFRDFCVKNGFAKYVDEEGNDIKPPRYNHNGFSVDDEGRPYSRSNPKPKVTKHYVGLKFHELRHTHITLQIGNGMDFRTASQRAGHSKVSTTLDIYSHAIPENDRAAAELIGSLLERPNSTKQATLNKEG